MKINFSNSDDGKSQKEAPLLSSQILSVGVQTEIAKWNDINLLKVEGYQKCCFHSNWYCGRKSCKYGCRHMKSQNEGYDNDCTDRIN